MATEGPCPGGRQPGRNGTIYKRRLPAKVPEHQGKNREVGYRSPPVETRFPSGQSGNPGGRPKGQSLTRRIADLLDGADLDGKPIPGGRCVADLLAEAIDRAGADLVLHGHAHRGTDRGLTPGGVRVRNVARTVIGAPYCVFELDGGSSTS